MVGREGMLFGVEDREVVVEGMDGAINTAVGRMMSIRAT